MPQLLPVWGALSSTLVQFLDSSRLAFLGVSPATKAMFVMPGLGVAKGETFVELFGDELPVIVLAVRLDVELAAAAPVTRFAPHQFN